MCFDFSQPRSHDDIGARMRDEHSRWLSEALNRGPFDLPRIPVRRADSGGFDFLTATARGRAVCERWWRRALRAIFL